jgi:hypothetical protein
MKQTAVEWLYKELTKVPNIYILKDLVKQAKKMEKQQIILSFNKGLSNWDNPSHYLGKEYYKETFKNK